LLNTSLSRHSGHVLVELSADDSPACDGIPSLLSIASNDDALPGCSRSSALVPEGTFIHLARSAHWSLMCSLVHCARQVRMPREDA
jgi:hypothetical protein